MSDEEVEYSEEEEEEEEEVEPAPPPAPEPQKSEAEKILEEKFKKNKPLEDDDQWKEYIAQWRAQRALEEEELRVLKDKQSKRKAEREQQEYKMNEEKRRQEEQRQREMEEKRAREQTEKLRRLEEAEKKRAAMMAALDTQRQTEVKPNFVIQKRDDGGPGASVGNTAMDKLMNVAAARGEMGKTKEQLAEDKRISLEFRVKALEIEGLSVEDLKEKAKEMWEKVVKLETEKYDLEERQKRQDYDLKELGERQRQMNRNRALKKGLDPDALSGKHPPKVQVASKFERRVDRRSYGDKKNLYMGGLEAATSATIEKIWEDRMMAFQEKKGKCPKWLGAEGGGKKPLATAEEEE